MSELRAKIQAVYYVWKKKLENSNVRQNSLQRKSNVFGSLVALYEDLSRDERTFYNNFRMSVRSFDHFVRKIEGDLSVDNFNFFKMPSVTELEQTYRTLG